MIFHIFIEVFIIFLLILKAFLHIRNINPLPVVYVTNIFPQLAPVVVFVFSELIVYFYT